MRSPSLIVAAAALVAGAALAFDANAEPISANAGGLTRSGGELGRAVASDQLSARHRRGHRTGARSGSRVGGPNNARPTGTQAPDAQMGGSGKGGAR
jgi:hypothetical protein